MKIKFAGFEVDDRMTVKELNNFTELSNILSINREPTAQEILNGI